MSKSRLVEWRDRRIPVKSVAAKSADRDASLASVARSVLHPKRDDLTYFNSSSFAMDLIELSKAVGTYSV